MSRLTQFLTTIFTVALLFGAVGCSSTSTSTESTADGDMGPPEDSELMINADSDSGNAGDLRTVNFDYNSSTLTEDARMTLEANADFLKENPSLSIQVEGHCDERGGVQYNLALGERRANAVRDYLIAMGVSSGNLSTISLGKERPLAFGHDEMSWAQNRRANFVITGK